MLKIEGIDFEFPQMGKEPKIGFSDEYIEKIMMSGLIRRIYKGRRFVATFSYAYLLDEQRQMLQQVLDRQKKRGYVNVVINSPLYDSQNTYTLQAIIELNNQQTRFAYSEVLGQYVWTNWNITLKGAQYEN